MNIAVLGDGAGLARYGLELAGHTCTGYELDPAKHHLSQQLGSGNCVLADMRDVDLSKFDAVWVSPPCQQWSAQRHASAKRATQFSEAELLEWALNLPHDVLWVENVISPVSTALVYRYRHKVNIQKWNAAQFLEVPIQKRRRYVMGRYKLPTVHRKYKANYPEWDVCPAVLASEYKQGGMARTWEKERRKATRWYGRPLSISEMAYHQGLEIPHTLLRSWWYRMEGFTQAQWRVNLCQAVGNGVPVYMARAFGLAHSKPETAQLELFPFEQAAA